MYARIKSKTIYIHSEQLLQFLVSFFVKSVTFCTSFPGLRNQDDPLGWWSVGMFELQKSDRKEKNSE